MSALTLQQSLKAASAMLMIVGIAVALAAHPATSGVANLFADLAFLPLDGHPHVEGSSARLLAAIGGGVMFGWGLMLWQVVAHVLPKDPALAANLIRTSVIAWFVVDSAASLVAGAYFNAAFNVVFLGLFLWPLPQLKSGGRAAA